MEYFLSEFEKQLSMVVTDFRELSRQIAGEHPAQELLKTVFSTLFNMQTQLQKALSDYEQQKLNPVSDNNRLYEMLYKSSLILTAETDTSRLLDLAIDTIINLSGAGRGFLALLDDAQNYTLISSRNMDRESIEHAEKEISNTVIRRVLQLQKEVKIDDPSTANSLVDKSSILQKGALPLICVPLFIDDKVKAVVYLDRFENDISTLSISLTKNFAKQLANFLKTTETLDHLKATNSELLSQLRKQFRFGNIICKSKSMVKMLQTISRVADTDVSVLIHGETGTGKELIARAIHENSLRASGPFIEVDCGALPPNIIESELFGYVRGAFTGANNDKIGLLESANGGTIFLDEINNMPQEFQTKLLRVLQQKAIRRLGENFERKVDFRLIAASSANLKEEMENKRFRQDLFYRINTVSVILPPLRERKEDILVLVNHFLEYYSEKYNRPVKSFTADFLRTLEQYHWPGNVRELEHVVERAIVLCQGETLTTADLPEEIRGLRVEVDVEHNYDSLETYINAAKKQYIEKVLKECQGKKVEAARRLQINRSYLFNLIKQLHIKA